MGVKSQKSFFDAIDFDEIGDSMDLWFNRLQNSFDFDAISDEDEFNAVVLSPPVPIGANSAELETFANGVRGSFTDTLPKFVFRARLIDVNSHHAFWPDPCDPEFIEDVGGQESALDWVSKHMKVMAIGATEVPRVGDTVRVKLDKQGLYTASPETATMIGVVTSLDSIISPAALASIESAECRTSLSKLFDGYTPPVPPPAPGSTSSMPFRINPSPVNPYDILLFGDSQMQGAIGRVLQGRFAGIRLSKVGSQAKFWINNGPLDTELRKKPRLIIIQLNSNGISGTDALIKKIKSTTPSSQIRWYGSPPATLAPTSWSKAVHTPKALASFNTKREGYNKVVEAKLKASGLTYTFIDPFRDIAGLRNWPGAGSDGIHIPDAVAKTFYASI